MFLHFNPRVPGGTRRWRTARKRRSGQDFNPRVPGGTRPVERLRYNTPTHISILASRVGRDRARFHRLGRAV